MISPNELTTLTAQLDRLGLSTTTINALRKQFPERHFTYCSQDDITVDHPVFETDAYAIYLIDTSEHCLRITTDLGRATGFVIAEIEQA